MIEITQLRQFPTPQPFSSSSYVCDIVILEPQDLGWDDFNEIPSRGDWRYVNVYIINHEPRLELNLGISHNFQLIQPDNLSILGDIKANGLICLWSPRGKLRVSSMSTLEIEVFDPEYFDESDD